jgi:hypothetical protein
MQGVEFRLSVVRSTRDSEGADFVYVCATSPPLSDAFDALPDDSVARARFVQLTRNKATRFGLSAA